MLVNRVANRCCQSLMLLYLSVCLPTTTGWGQDPKLAEDASIPISRVDVQMGDTPVLRFVHRLENAAHNQLHLDLPPGITTLPEDLVIESGQNWQASVVPRDVTAGSKQPGISDDPLSTLRTGLGGHEVVVSTKTPEQEVQGKLEAVDNKYVVLADPNRSNRDIVPTSQISRIALSASQPKPESTHRLVLTRARASDPSVSVSYSLAAPASTDTSYEFGILPNRSELVAELRSVDRVTNAAGMNWNVGTTIRILDGELERQYDLLAPVQPQTVARLQSTIAEMKAQSLQLFVQPSKQSFLNEAEWQFTASGEIGKKLAVHPVRVLDPFGNVRFTTKLAKDRSQAAILKFPYSKNLDLEWLVYSAVDTQESVAVVDVHGLWIDVCTTYSSRIRLVKIHEAALTVSLDPGAESVVKLMGVANREITLPAGRQDFETAALLGPKRAVRSDMRILSTSRLKELALRATTVEHAEAILEVAELLTALKELERQRLRSLGSVSPATNLATIDLSSSQADQQFAKLQQRLLGLSLLSPPAETFECQLPDFQPTLNGTDRE